MRQNIITPDDRREVLKKIEVGGLTIKDNGKVYGYIKKEIQEQIDFDELIEKSDAVKGKAVISFQEAKNGHEL